MEEVWKDITLSSLHDQHSRFDHDFPVGTPPANLHRPNHHHSAAAFRSIILQDFLSSSSPKDSAGAGGIVFPSGAGPPLPAPAPATVLSLNSGREFHFRPDLNPQCEPISHPFDEVLENSQSFGKKRIQESDSNNPADRRQKRMIKNRESAARSRARKQAYTNELELEVAHLMEENARLRRQQDQFRIAAAAQVPRKYRLNRTSTAPF